MYKPNPENRIYVIGSQHGVRGFENLSLVQQKTQAYFIPKDENGITNVTNLFLLECFDGTEAMTKAFKGLKPNQSALEAYLNTELPSLPPSVIARQAAVIRTASTEQRDYLHSKLMMVDELRKSFSVMVDCEHYSDEQGIEHRRIAGVTHHLIELAIGNLAKGKSKDANRLYVESLLKEVKPFDFRNRAIARLVTEDVEELSANQESTVAIVSIGDGHVKSLVKAMKDTFAKTGLNPTIEGIYIGPRSYRYELVNQLIENPNRKLDYRLVTIALLHSVFDLPSFERIAQKVNKDVWLDLLKRTDTNSMDRLLRRIATLGLIDGITQFIEARKK